MNRLRFLAVCAFLVALFATLGGCDSCAPHDDPETSPGGSATGSTGGAGVGGATSDGGEVGGATCDPANCPPASEECVIPTCNPDGSCGELAKPDGAACDDKDPCTQSDTCQSAACVGAAPITCSVFQSCSVGACVYDPIAYVKASNTNLNDYFGTSVALSADGNTLAVGAYLEDSIATGVNGDQSDNSADGAGAVYVFTRSGFAWSQQAYLKALNTGPDDLFGVTVALSADGATLAVGATLDDSAATGVNGDPADIWGHSSGAVHVFTRSSGAWSQQAYIKASNTEPVDYFGTWIALSGEGDTLAVGAPEEDSAAAGVNGDQLDNSAPDSGAVYVFVRSGATWSQQAYIKASNTEAGDHFGWGAALSADGNTLAVGAALEDSSAAGVDADQSSSADPNFGAVYVFVRSGAMWSQQAYIKASNPDPYDYFGESAALSADGNTLAVSAHGEASDAAGVGGDETDNSISAAGAAYIFVRSGATWSQQAYIKASNPGNNCHFGWSVALSSDGAALAVGAHQEQSGATGINGDQTDDSLIHAGAAYLFTQSGGAWSQQAYIKAPNTEAWDYFGYRVALSGDGTTLAVGANEEDGSATGVGGDPSDNSAPKAGAVYVYQ